MDEALIKRIADTQFFSQSAVEELIRTECGDNIGEITICTNGTIYCANHKENGGLLLIFRFKPLGVMAEAAKDECRGFVLGGCEKKAVDIIYYKGTDAVGILRKSDEKKPALLEFLNGFRANTGDIYEPDKKMLICGDDICGIDDSVIMMYLALSCFKNIKKSSKKLTIALINESVCGEGGLAEIIRQNEPDSVAAVYAAEETEEFKLGSGTAAVIKDGNYVMTDDFKNMLDSAFGSELGCYVGKTDTGMERMSISGRSGRVYGFCIPVKNSNTPICRMSAKDVEKTKNLLLKISCSSDII